MCIGSSEEQFALYKVDLNCAAFLSSEAHSCSTLWICKVATDDQRVCPQIVIETKHHRVASLHHHIYHRGMKKRRKTKPLHKAHNANNEQRFYRF